jgi:hypothetical protein
LTQSRAHPRRRSLLEHRSVFLLTLAFLLGISLAAEFTSYARPDTGFLLDAAGRVLDGARLYVDVVEINPPLIVGLNILAVLAARLLDISDILAYRIGFTTLLLGAFLLTGVTLRRLIPDELVLRRAFLLVLGFVLFPLAGQDYGEREHLVLALVVPYLVLAAARRVGRPVPPAHSVITGLLAGLAFALKPHFLVLWVLCELYVRTSRMVRRRAPLPETLTVAGVLATYGIAIAVVTPQYPQLVRLLAGSYNRFLYDPFFHVLLAGPGAVLAIFALLAFVALRPHARQPELWQAIALGTAACLLAGAAQQKGLRYHLYPSFGLAIVLLGLIAWDSVQPPPRRLRLIYRRLAVSVLAAATIVVCIENAAVAASGGQDGDRRQFEELVHVVRAHGGTEGVFVMSYHLRSAYPLINYSGARSASRFPHLWVLAAEYLDALKASEPLVYRDEARMSPSERYLNRAVLEDLRRNDPRLLVVFRHARDVPVNGFRRLDYIAYFTRNPQIEQILRNYELVAELGDYLVYQRVASGSARTGPPPVVAPGTRDVIGVGESGVHLRLADPSLLVAVGTFLLSLLFQEIVERRSSRLRPMAEIAAVRGE